MNENIKNEGVKFSAENQPSREAKSKGAKNRWARVKIANMIASGDMQSIASEMEKAFGIPYDEIDIKTLLWLKTVHLGIVKGNIIALKEALDRIEGKAKLSIDHTTGGDSFLESLSDEQLMAEVERLRERDGYKSEHSV